MEDLYKILGVPKEASPEEIKKAYKQMAKKHHPDRGGNSNHFHLVNVAGQILRDHAKRKEYDETGNCINEPEESKEILAEKTFVRFFFQVFSQTDLDQLKYKNLINVAIKQIQQEIAKSKEHLSVLNTNIKEQKKLLKRIKTKKSKLNKGLVFKAIQNNINEQNIDIEIGKKEIATLLLAKKIGEEYQDNPQIKEEEYPPRYGSRLNRLSIW